MDRDYMAMIDDERCGQYRTRAHAQSRANLETMQTHRKHQVFLTHTWRNGVPRLCWTVVLSLKWRGNNLVTK